MEVNMPKIIENPREALIAEAKYQVEKYGYAGMTIRSVSKACNIGVGTVYNYFKSKEELIFSFMHEEWLACLEAIKKCGDETDSPEVLLRCVHTEINKYVEDHRHLLTDKNAEKVFSLNYFTAHTYLRDQLAEVISPVCMPHAKNKSPLLMRFISEAILIWATAGTDFDEIYSILKDHFVDASDSEQTNE
jgi:AcrR family transcriptional regulator